MAGVLLPYEGSDIVEEGLSDNDLNSAEGLISEEHSCLQLGSSNAIRQVIYRDIASSKNKVATTLGFVEGYIEGHRCCSLILDGGSAVCLINERYVDRCRLSIMSMPKAGMIRIANDEIQQVTCVRPTLDEENKGHRELQQGDFNHHGSKGSLPNHLHSPTPQSI